MRSIETIGVSSEASKNPLLVLGEGRCAMSRDNRRAPEVVFVFSGIVLFRPITFITEFFVDTCC